MRAAALFPGAKNYPARNRPVTRRDSGAASEAALGRLDQTHQATRCARAMAVIPASDKPANTALTRTEPTAYHSKNTVIATSTTEMTLNAINTAMVVRSFTPPTVLNVRRVQFAQPPSVSGTIVLQRSILVTDCKSSTKLSLVSTASRRPCRSNQKTRPRQPKQHVVLFHRRPIDWNWNAGAKLGRAARCVNPIPQGKSCCLRPEICCFVPGGGLMALTKINVFTHLGETFSQ